MWTVETLMIVVVTFLIAGFVKGVAGLGLPTISLALLTATVGLKEAMVLMLMPSFVTNVWQGIVGGAFSQILRRLWPLFAAGCIGIWLAVGVVARADTKILVGILGVLLCLYAGVSLATPQVPPLGKKEGWLSPIIGGVTGILTGLTGSFVIPSVLYFQALGLPRDMLIQTMGMWFTTATVALAVGLGSQRLLPADLGLLSASAVIPAILGMMLGQRIRQRIPEGRFRLIFFYALLVLGVYITGKAFL